MSNPLTSQLSYIAKYYENLVNIYGHDPRACDYGRSQSQKTKFEVLARVLPLQNKRVLDVGCGFADFADYLSSIYGEISYEGIDISPHMIKKASCLHPNLSLQVKNILDDHLNKTYDLVTANGIFYLLGTDAELYMQKLIVKMYELSSCAVAFNSLSSWAEKKELGEFYADPLATVRFCRTLTPWVVLRHDYMPHDFTIYMYKEQQNFQ